MDNPRLAPYTLIDFLKWRENSSLQITPKFQRRPVWSPSQRSYFIDTMLQGMPSPPIYLRNIYDVDKQTAVHEVIDGQQRLKAVLDFVDGKYAISKKLDAPYKGLTYSKLSHDQKQAVLKYKFNCEAFEAITDKEVFEVFRRMNTYATPLTKQELRHGRFFGPFSQACHALAVDHLGFWRTHKILSERKIARMAEVQLTSALLVSQVDGLQDKNDSLDEFYDKYDDTFSKRKTYERQFRVTIDQIGETMGEALADSQFRNAPFFYTLFGTVYHRTFGMPKQSLATTRKPLTASERDGLKEATSTLSEVINVARVQQQVTRKPTEPAAAPRYPTRFSKFAAACLSGTDNINPRQTRLSTLYREAFG